jgi:hypothetical protein
MVPWVNLHGGFLIGIVLIALLLMVRLAERLIWRRPHALLPLATTLAATFLATFANPSGVQGSCIPHLPRWRQRVPRVHHRVAVARLSRAHLDGLAWFPTNRSGQSGWRAAALGLWPLALFA